jgi:hypothetical protein
LSKQIIIPRTEEDTNPADLTEKQAAFVQAFVRGETAGNATKSAIAAGYSAASAPNIGSMVLKHEGVALAIDAALRDEIGVHLTAQAVAVMREIIGDKSAPLKLRGDIASRIVEYSGIVDRVRIEKSRATGLDAAQAPGVKRLGEMTRQELEAVCHQGAAILQAAAALPQPGQTIDAQVSAQPEKVAAE